MKTACGIRALKALVLAALLATAHAQPFNASLLGGNFGEKSPCFIRFASDRFMTGSSVQVTAQTIVYNPPSCPSCDADAPATFCYERIELRYTRRNQHPYITRYLKATLNQSTTCEAGQPIEKYWPWFKRTDFIDAYRRMVTGISDIQVFTCPQNPQRYLDNRYIGSLVQFLRVTAWEFYIAL